MQAAVLSSSGTVMGSPFVLFDVSMEITLGQDSVYAKRLHTKASLPASKSYLPMGKRASVTTAIDKKKRP